MDFDIGNDEKIDANSKAHYCIRRVQIGEIGIITCKCGYVGTSGDPQYSNHPKLQLTIQGENKT